MLTEIIIILLIILAVELILSFTASSFTESIVLRVTDWCLGKMEAYEAKSVSRLSIGGIIKTVCSVIVTTFKRIEKIENPRLKTGLKLNALSIIVSILLALLSVLVIAILYIVIIAICLYIFWKILVLIGRHLEGKPLFNDDIDKPHRTQTNPLLKAHKITKSFWTDDKILKDKNGKKVGSISKSFRDEDRQIIKDASRKQAGDIKTSFWDDDKQIIRDSSEKQVGDIKTSFWTGERIIEDDDGKKHGTIRKNWADETIIDDKK